MCVQNLSDICMKSGKKSVKFSEIPKILSVKILFAKGNLATMKLVKFFRGETTFWPSLWFAFSPVSQKGYIFLYLYVRHNLQTVHWGKDLNVYSWESETSLAWTLWEKRALEYIWHILKKSAVKMRILNTIMSALLFYMFLH